MYIVGRANAKITEKLFHVLVVDTDGVSKETNVKSEGFILLFEPLIGNGILLVLAIQVNERYARILTCLGDQPILHIHVIARDDTVKR